MFNKWEAQRWWGENYDRIVELYNVVTFSGRMQGSSTPVSSVDDSVLVGIGIATLHYTASIVRFDPLFTRQMKLLYVLDART